MNCCEGPYDEHVVWHLPNRHEGMPDFYILQKEGIENLPDFMGLVILEPGRTAIGILVDANDDLNARWTALFNRLREEEIKVPESPEASGTILDCTPRIDIWLIPDNYSSGELEDFVSEMIPDDDAVWPLARNYIDCIPEEHRRFAEKKIQRAKLHAWLATREDPRPMGFAICAGDLRVDGNLSTTFSVWLRKLFNLNWFGTTS